LTDLKTKEAVDDNVSAEREASRAEIRWCFVLVDVLKIRRQEMKQTCDSIPLFMNCGIMRLPAGTAHEESAGVAISFHKDRCEAGCYHNSAA
jgi:hypothetical protein